MNGTAHIICTPGGRKAAVLAVLMESMPDKIDVVLLDMMMPVMGGEEAFSRLVELRPDVVVVAASGFDESEAQARFGHRIAGFVQKPFTLGQLGAKIGAAIRAKP